MKWSTQTGFNSLDISPEEGFFFLPHQFYCSLKETIISKEDYDSVKKFYQTMKLKNLGELNILYNFHDTIILCEYLKTVLLSYKNFLNTTQESVIPQVLLVFVSLETKASVWLLFQQKLNMLGFLKKILIVGFSCVNTRLALDSQILLPKDNIDNNKLIFDLKINKANQKKK